MLYHVILKKRDSHNDETQQIVLSKNWQTAKDADDDRQRWRRLLGGKRSWTVRDEMLDIITIDAGGGYLALLVDPQVEGID